MKVLSDRVEVSQFAQTLMKRILTLELAIGTLRIHRIPDCRGLVNGGACGRRAQIPIQKVIFAVKVLRKYSSN